MATNTSYRLSVLTEQDKIFLRSKTSYVLPDNPSDKQWSPAQIKRKWYEGTLLLFEWLKKTQSETNQLLDEIAGEQTGDITYSYVVELGNFNSKLTTEDNIKEFVKKLIQNKMSKSEKSILFVGSINNNDKCYAFYDKTVKAVYFHLTVDSNDLTNKKYFKDYVITYNEKLEYEVIYIAKVTADDLDYNKLKNKPSINGIELIEDKTFEDLGLFSLTTEDINKIFN